MNVPDYVSPVVGYRAWLLDPCGLTSLNGEFWHPNQQLQAVCRKSIRHTPPRGNCTCGIYAAKSFDQLRTIGYARYAHRGVRGEAYLWGTVVEHKLGWRAQFAYPKTLVVSPESLEELESLKILIEYGADLFVAGEKGNVPLWTKQCRGFDHVREVAARLAAEAHAKDHVREVAARLAQVRTPQQQIRLVIVEDEEYLRICLRHRLEREPDLKVVGAASDTAEAMKLVRQCKPDILTLCRLEDSGFDTLRALNETPVKVIMVTTRDRKSDIVEALQLGARGYVVKPFAGHVLLKAIRTVMAGEYWVLREPVSNLEPYLRNA
jgi:CheY-like chemotaxis protein